MPALRFLVAGLESGPRYAWSGETIRGRFEGAYGPTSNLMDCQFPYIVDDPSQIPVKAPAESSSGRASDRPPRRRALPEIVCTAWTFGHYRDYRRLELLCGPSRLFRGPESRRSVQVAGHYYVHRDWEKIFPQATFGGPFEMPLEAIERPDGGCPRGEEPKICVEFAVS